MQGNVLRSAFTYKQEDQKENEVELRNVLKEYKSGIMDPARLVAR